MHFVNSMSSVELIWRRWLAPGKNWMELGISSGLKIKPGNEVKFWKFLDAFQIMWLFFRNEGII